MMMILASRSTYEHVIAVAKSARHVDLNYNDWKDMLVSKTTVSSENASVTDHQSVTEASSDETASRSRNLILPFALTYDIDLSGS